MVEQALTEEKNKKKRKNTNKYCVLWKLIMAVPWFLDIHNGNTTSMDNTMIVPYGISYVKICE